MPSAVPRQSSSQPNVKPAAKLHLAIIGLGKIGRVHYENLLQVPGAEIIAIAEPNPASCGDLEARIRLHEHWHDILTDPDIDAVVITLPHSLHAECAEKALRNGKHVFLEKPLATTLKEAQALVACAQGEGKTLMINMTHRFYPPIRQARHMIQEGILGEIVTVHDHYMEVIDRTEFPAWFFDPVFAGGGVTMTDSIHLVDRVSWLLGEPLCLKGQAARTLDSESQVEDCSELICQSKSGIAATIGSFFCFDSAKTWNDRLVLFGTKGTLVVHAWSHLEWTPHAGKTQRIEGYAPGVPQSARVAIGHRAAVEEFLSAIRENRVPEAAGQSVLNAQEIIQQFYDNLNG